MTNIEVYNELTRLFKLVAADPEDVQSAFNLYRILLTSDVHLCSSCPSSVRGAFKSLKSYYNKHSEYLKDNPNTILQNKK